MQTIEVIYAQAENPDLISIGIAVLIIAVLLVAIGRAIYYGIGGGILGAIIAPLFMGIDPIQGAIGGGIVFAFLGLFASDEK